MNHMFTVENLHTHYGDKAILKDISVEIPRHAITAIIGPSGCGKSTFLRCLNRMNDLAPGFHMTGNVQHENDDIYHTRVDVTDIRRRIGMVFQKPNPFPKSIYDNVAYGLRIQGMRDRREINRIVHDSLEKAALWDEVKGQLKQSALSLSGGQQQRLCIARTIAISPDVILFDEPCSALDPIATRKIEELMVSLKNDYTIVVVTHNLQQARRIADYVALFHLGELIEFGTTKQLFEDPTHQITGDYIQGVFG